MRAMYYDLITSLPHLPHFEKAERLPITPLRLSRRLLRLEPSHAEQLAQARSLVNWPRTGPLTGSESDFIEKCTGLMVWPLDVALREYVAFRMDQQTILAALRRKRQGDSVPSGDRRWGVGPRVHHLQKHWDVPDFRLGHFHPWILPARDLMESGDALGLERLMMDVAWKRLDRCAERNMFSFEAVFAYVFKWDILQAWLAADADKATIRCRELIEEVTHVDPS